MEIVEFLRARLDEDEAAAKAWLPFGNPDDAQREHMARHDPARVLAEVDAKRKLLGSHYDYRGVCTRCFDWQNKPVEREQFPCEVVRLLALPYADHPDYRDEWRP